MKRILIEWLHCDGKGPVCSGPATRRELIKNTIEAMRPFMRTMQVQLDFREVTLTGDGQPRADALKINGKEIEELTDAAHKSTGCARPDAAPTLSLPGGDATGLRSCWSMPFSKKAAALPRAAAGAAPTTSRADDPPCVCPRHEATGFDIDTAMGA